MKALTPAEWDAEQKAQRELIDACNLMCGYVAASLPRGWGITLAMNSDEASMELTDPFGNVIDIDGADNGTSMLKHLCDAAREGNDITDAAYVEADKAITEETP